MNLANPALGLYIDSHELLSDGVVSNPPTSHFNLPSPLTSTPHPETIAYNVYGNPLASYAEALCARHAFLPHEEGMRDEPEEPLRGRLGNPYVK